MRNYPRPTPVSRRRGTVLVMFLICLLLMVMTTGSIVRVMMLQRSAVQARDLEVQAEWLLQSGVARSVARLRTDNDYSGETWVIEQNAWEAPYRAEITIRVNQDVADLTRRRVVVDVIVPTDRTQRAFVTREFDVRVSSRGTTS